MEKIKEGVISDEDLILKINEIVEWINKQQAKIDLQGQYKQ